MKKIRQPLNIPTPTGKLRDRRVIGVGAATAAYPLQIMAKLSPSSNSAFSAAVRSESDAYIHPFGNYRRDLRDVLLHRYWMINSAKLAASMVFFAAFTADAFKSDN